MGLVRKLNLMLKYKIIIWFAGVLLCSCNQVLVYEQYQPINNSTWPKDKEYYFIFNIEDTTRTYDVTLQLRNNNRYSYQNLWVFILEEKPVGAISRDTVECFLADDYGKWLGHGISLFESTIPLRNNYKFPYPGQYTFAIRQGMRDSSIIGIQEIGLVIKPITAVDEKHLSEEK